MAARTRVFAVLFGMLGAVPAAAQPVAATRWETYANPRFGTTIDRPADLFTEQLRDPENGGGRSWTTADGRAALAVFGSFNALDLTPARFVAEFHDALVPFADYTRVERTWFVLTGNKDGTEFYKRCNYTRDLSTMHCFEITYPAAEARAWDRVVTRLSKSLRIGRGADF